MNQINLCQKPWGLNNLGLKKRQECKIIFITLASEATNTKVIKSLENCIESALL